MADISLSVGIAAETIPNIEGGLGYFIITALDKLARSHPSWQFTVVASSGLGQLQQIKTDKANVDTIIWDKGFGLRAVLKALGKLDTPERSRKLGFYVGRKLPFHFLRAQFGNLQTIWKSLNVDVIWVPHFAINTSLPSVAYDLGNTKAPIVFTVHDIHPVYFPEDWPADARDRFWLEFVPFFKNSNRIITHTHFQKEGMVKHIGIEESRIGVTAIPPLIEPSNLLAGIRDESDRIALLEKHRILSQFALYPASTTHSHKNHVRLILAWHALRQRLGSDCPTLVCTAKGHLWPVLKSLIEALELEGTVIFTDTLDTLDLATLYNCCMFVIVPTLYEGGGSGPVAESLMVGKPVICSNIPQIKEQMDVYQCQVNTFDPTSINSIAETAEWTVRNLDLLQTQAKENMERLLLIIPRLWSGWTSFYAEQLREAAQTSV